MVHVAHGHGHGSIVLDQGVLSLRDWRSAVPGFLLAVWTTPSDVVRLLTTLVWNANRGSTGCNRPSFADQCLCLLSACREDCFPETLAFLGERNGREAIGATVTTYFSLFGLVAYTPAIHVAAIGLMLLLTEVVIYLDTGSCRLWLSALSSFLACAAKQETLAASVIVVGSLCLFDRWLWFQGKTISAWLTHYVKLGLACFVPAALLYIQWGQIAGWTKFLACLSGFGLAKTACPWWPTGFGLLGAASSLAKAAFILLIGALFCYRKNWPSRLPRRSMVVLLAAISMAVFLYAEWGLFADLIAGSGSIGKRIARFGQELLSTRSVLRPVLWAGMALSVVLAWKTLKLLRTSRKTPLDPEIIKWLLLLT